MNNSRLFAIANQGIIKNNTYAKYNDKGDIVITEKNLYMLNLVKKALTLKAIGYNFVIDLKYCDKLDTLSNETTTRNSQYDNTRYYIKQDEFVNLLNMVNLKLTDRQLFLQKNKNNQFIVKVFDYKSHLHQVFIRDKNSSCIKLVEHEDIETHEIYTIEEKSKSGMFYFTMDKDNGFYKKSVEFMTSWENQISMIDVKIPGFIDSMATLENKGVNQATA